MKRFPLLLVFLLLGCSKKDQPKPDVVVAPPKDEQPAPPPKPTVKTIDFSEFGYRLSLELPFETQVEQLPSGRLKLTRKPDIDIAIDPFYPDFGLAEPQAFDPKNPQAFFLQNLPAKDRFSFEKYKAGDKTGMRGRLQLGWVPVGVSVEPKFSDAEVDKMIALVGGAKFEDAMKEVERKQLAAIEKLAAGGAVIGRDGSTLTLGLDKPFPKELQPALADFVDLAQVRAHNNPPRGAVKDADVDLFSVCKNIRVVDLPRTAVTDKCLETIGKWRRLSLLVLSHNNIAGTGLVHLRGCQALEALALNHCPVRSTAIGAVADLPIKALQLSFTDVTDSVTESLVKMRDLETLDLAECKLEGKTLAALGKLPKLKQLNLEYASILPANIPQLSQCKELGGLSLAGVNLTGVDLAFLKPLEKLQQLVVADTQLTAEAFVKLEPGKNWKRLDVGLLNLPKATFEAFEKKYPQVGKVSPYGPESPALPKVEPPVALDKLPKADAVKKIEALGGTYERDDEAEGKPIKRVLLKNTKAKDFDLADLRELTKLETLDLTGCGGVTDGGLPYLAGLTNLRNLRLEGTAVAGNGFESLKGMTKLFRLELPARTNMQGYTPKQLDPLKALKELENISCIAGAFPLESLQALDSWPKLKEVAVEFTGLNQPEWFRRVVRIPTLESLRLERLGNSGVPGALLPLLADAKELRKLELDTIPSTRDEDWKKLFALNQLKELSLSGPEVTDLKIAWLRELPELEKLEIENASLTDKGAAIIGRCSKLHSLLLNQTGLTGAGLAAIGEFPELEELAILSLTGVGDEQFAKLAGLEELRTLQISGDLKITGKGWQALQKCKRLRRLRIAASEPGEGFAEGMRNINSLVEIDLRGTPLTKPADMETILALPELRKLVLPASRKDWPEALKASFAKHPQVTVLFPPDDKKEPAK